MIREAVSLDRELTQLVEDFERDVSDVVRQREPEVETARVAVRLQTELLEADLADPPKVGAAWERLDAAATAERYESARAALDSARALAHALRQLRTGGEPQPGAGDDRVAELERELERQRAVEADLRAVIAAQREDLAESARIVETALFGTSAAGVAVG